MTQAIDRIRAAANLSVGRGCFFAALAIWMIMTGLIGDVLRSLTGGAVLTTFTGAVLFWKAARAPGKPCNSTELWILLDKADRPAPAAAAQRVLGSVLAEVYGRYGRWAMAIAGLFWLAAGLLWLLRR